MNLFEAQSNKTRSPFKRSLLFLFLTISFTYKIGGYNYETIHWFLTLLESANTHFKGWDFSFISETGRMKSSLYHGRMVALLSAYATC